MKNLFTLALLGISGISSFGQLVLNSNEMLPYGSTYSLRTVSDPSDVDTTIVGQNVTWDFSNLQADGVTPDFTVNIVNPASTPYASSFPTANYAFLEQPSNAYRYFTLTSSKLERVGSFTTSLKTYSDPQIEYVFPFQFGTSNTDTWQNSGSTFGGTYSLECIGTGTLKLPSGTNSSALMVRVVTVESFLTLTYFFWYDANDGSVLLQYIVGDGVFVSESAKYITDVHVGIDEATAFGGLRYTNPVTDRLNITLENTANDAYDYRLFDAQGRTVSSGFIANSGSQLTASMYMNTLASGVYFLSLTGKSTSASTTVKLVKN